ncbi:unnamed protein product [Symbiodinium microadriaticum]|nr:unnamed protein product [Symbiodinium microadriaticum]
MFPFNVNHRSCFSGQVEENGKKPAAYNKLCTSTAALDGNLFFLQLYTEVGGFLDAAGLQAIAGSTPLHWAARYGHAPIVRLLLDSKASPDEQNNMGDTAMHEVVAKANLSLRNRESRTPLEALKPGSLARTGHRLLAGLAMRTALLACFVLSHAELLCWRNSVPKRSRSAWSNARCLLQSSAEVPQCSWRVASRSATRWEVTATLDIHSDALCGVAWSPNQQRILTASADGTVGVWEEQNISYSPVQNHDPEAFQLVAILGSNSHSPVRDATWSPDSELILAASLDGSARVWQLEGDARRILRNVSGEDFRSDNASEDDNFTRLRPPAVQGRLLEPWSVHSMLMQSDTALAVEWSSNESAVGRVLAGSRERTACVSHRDAGFKPCASSHELAERSTGASYLLGLDHSASIWHASKEIPSRWALEATLEGVHHLMVSVRWSPDGKELLTGGNDGLARIWTLTDTDFQGSGRQRWNLRAKMQVHSQAVRAVAWSPDGQHVLTSGRKGYAYIWHPLEGDADWVLKGFLTQANGMEVPPNLTNTALHSPVNPERLDTLHSDSNMGWVSDWSPVHVASWSSDGRRIATGSPDGSVRLWLNDVSVYGRWTLEATLHGHSHEIWSLAWSPDSRELVTGDQLGRARLWRMRDEDTQH